MINAEAQKAPPPASGQEAVPKEGIRLRALIIGALAVAATAVLVTQAELVLQTLKIGYLQFPPSPWACCFSPSPSAGGPGGSPGAGA